MLRGIDAVNNLHILKLAGCVNISGSGLDTLRSSVAIEQIDLSLVGKHESPIIEPEPLLFEDVLIPILDSIINRGSSLKQLEFPKNWRNSKSTSMTLFLDRYDDYLMSQRYYCFKCDTLLTGGREWTSPIVAPHQNGTQNCTCTLCLKHFCYNCTEEDGSEFASWCTKCEKLYCEECSPSTECSNCYLYFCNECEEMKECLGDHMCCSCVENFQNSQ